MQAPAILSATPVIPGAVTTSMQVGADVHDTRLHPDEVQLALTLAAVRRPTFVAGRIALRTAMAAALPNVPRDALLRTSRGGPLLPEGVSGSISHKRDRAVAIAAPQSNGGAHATFRHVGIDLEQRPTEASVRPSHHRSLADRILTANEREAIAHLGALEHREATILHFALKEAIYKAIDPVVQRYVRFTEVELELSASTGGAGGHEAGVARVSLLLAENPPLVVVASWQHDAHYIIATAMSEAAER